MRSLLADDDEREALGPALRARLRSGEIVAGMMVYELFSPAVPAVLAAAGADFAVFDMESTGLGHDLLRLLASLSRAAGLTPIVRVPHATAEEVGRCLDLGVGGVMAPKISDGAAARAFAAAVRYPPDGTRGSGYSSHPSWHLTPASATDKAEANREVLAVCQLESVAAVENAEEIVAVPGIDVVNVGVNDLSAQLGVSPTDARVQQAVDRVLALCGAYGKAYCGKLAAATSAASSRLLSRDHRMVLIDHDVAALAARVRQAVDEVDGLRETRTR